MRYPAIPTEEFHRQREVARYRSRLLRRQHLLEEVVERAVAQFGADIGHVSIIEDDCHWNAAKVGTRLNLFGRAESFCAHTILEDRPLVVPDLARDIRFFDNPAVTDLGLRFYAGVPIRMSSGHHIGALCVASRLPRRDAGRELGDLLEELAEEVVLILEDDEAKPASCQGSTGLSGGAFA